MPPVPWGRIFTSRDVWLMVIAYFAFGYVAFIFLTWFFIYLAEGRGLNLKSSAVYAMLPFIAMTSCCLAGGVISDWLCRIRGPYVGRCVYGALTLFLAAVFLVIGSHAENTTMAVLALAGGAGALVPGAIHILGGGGRLRRALYRCGLGGWSTWAGRLRAH